MNQKEKKCFICLAPGVEEIKVTIDSSKKEETCFICKRHLMDYNKIKKKNKGSVEDFR